VDIVEQIGQLFMLGFDGTAVSPEWAELQARYKPGGMILFARNLEDPAQIIELTNGLQARSPHFPLLIAIDSRSVQSGRRSFCGKNVIAGINCREWLPGRNRLTHFDQSLRDAARHLKARSSFDTRAHFTRKLGQCGSGFRSHGQGTHRPDVLIRGRRSMTTRQQRQERCQKYEETHRGSVTN